MAALFVAAWLASIAVERPFAIRYSTLQTWTLAIDILLTAALLAVALKANRRWPMAVVSLQAIILLVHLVKVIDPLLIRSAYEKMTVVWPMIQVLLLIVGTILHASRVKKLGSVPSWSSSSSQSPR